MTIMDLAICYLRERQRAVEHLAESLRYYGYAVWPGQSLIDAGGDPGRIAASIEDLKAVVALWCTMSVASEELRLEAEAARARGQLISVKIANCDLPPGLGGPVELAAWDGSPRSVTLDPLLDAISAKVGRPPAPDWRALREYEGRWRRSGAQSLRSFAVRASFEFEATETSLGFGAGEGRETGAGASALALAMTEWQEIRDSLDIRRLSSFAAHFPGYYGDLAIARVGMLEKGTAPMRPDGTPAAAGRAGSAVRVAAGAPPDPDAVLWIKAGGGRQPAESFRDLPDGPEMVVVPACPGGFLMGSPGDEPERLPERERQRAVTIAKPFALGRFAVTRGEFAKFVAATGHDMGEGEWLKPGFRQGDRHPVVCVNWEDAAAYASWLAHVTGKPYRLPSEAEWEYAARAGATTPFWWGKTIATVQANYDGNRKYAGSGSKGLYRQTTLPVDYADEEFRPNPWGLHQVHGNVWEWCEDCWNETLPAAPCDGSAILAGDCDFRVLRGGSRIDFPGFLRCAFRNCLAPWLRANIVGFRVARTLTF